MPLVVPTRRYLVRFDPKRIPHIHTDVLILGGGIAGIRAALEVDNGLETVIVTKDRLAESNSNYAQGGIAGVLDPLDDFAHHTADTIAAGKGLCDERIVASIVEEAPQRIRELIACGAKFDEAAGELALTREGGHSHRRIVHALGDATGMEVMRALRQKVTSREGSQIWEETFLIDLLTTEEGCVGALIWNRKQGRVLVWAQATILCTGGAGRLFRETTNPEIATADGHAAALRAGCELRDMEFMQFHPTVLYIAGSGRHLISEAVRGEGGLLRNSRGELFMERYTPQKELAPRDEVSRAITAEMERTGQPCVYLDLSGLAESLVRERFPNIGQVCAGFGLDIARDLIPVRPGAHYLVGGATIDAQGATTVPYLWAAGEATSSGLHGANRLASNSLLEGLVFGRRCGREASHAAQRMPDHFRAPGLSADWPQAPRAKAGIDLEDVRNALQALLTRQVGISRDAPGLVGAAEQIQFWDQYVSAQEFDRPRGWELQNLLLTAKMMITAATERTESRGVHFRGDYPEPDPAWARHLALTAK